MRIQLNTIAVMGVATVAIVSSTAHAAGQASANYTMAFDTFNNGTADMTSANFRLGGSLGEPIAGAGINSASFQIRGGFRAQLNASQAVLNLLSVVSRKMHGATPFQLLIDHQKPITGAITVEPRAMGGGHTLVFHFDGNVNLVGAATALDAMMNSAGIATPARSGNDVIVTLTNVPDNTRLTITLTGINGSGTAQASMGFLIGDVNSSRAVTAADIAAIKANQPNAVNSDLRALFDLNADGTINAADVAAAKARSGTPLR